MEHDNQLTNGDVLGFCLIAGFVGFVIGLAFGQAVTEDALEHAKSQAAKA